MNRMSPSPSSSSTIDSSSCHHPPPHTSRTSSVFPHRQFQTNQDLNTDLLLGLNISSTSSQIRKEKSDHLPPIKRKLAEKSSPRRRRSRGSLFVKVYMEGIPIGRKVDLCSHGGYNSLISTLPTMFETTSILRKHKHNHHHYELTYEDEEGDWMMVGDVPWEMFLSTVKKLKIARANRLLTRTAAF